MYSIKDTFVATVKAALIIIVIGVVAWVLGYKVLNRPEIKVETEMVTCKEALTNFSKLYQATSEVGQIPYDASYSDCYDHSKLLTQKLAEKNIRSSVMVNKDRSHAWVAVWIEATSGQFVPIEGGEQELLEVRDGSDIKQVQCYNKYEP